MRSISQHISERLKQHIQTMANVADPSTRMWISRPSTVLVNDQFLERQTVATGPVSDVSIAVCHPREMRSNTQIYMGYISGGKARVFSAKHKSNIDSHAWIDTEFEASATAISLAYDGTMPKSDSGYVEFVTEQYPWVFWVNNSTLYGWKLYSEQEPTVLVETNCTDVSTIRAMHSSAGSFDFGLVIFFIVNGQLFYRQLINGEWMDAEVISFGPSVRWSEVAAFRTWDYRIGVQAKDTDGHIYELFTQFMGVGKQNTEHIEIKNARIESAITNVSHSNVRSDEHVHISNAVPAAPYRGLYSLDVPVITSARNVEADDGDWGKIVIVEFSNYLVASQVSDNSLQFSLVDSRNSAYYPTEATLDANGTTVTLTFTDFNPAYGTCELRYTPGEIYSLATVKVEATSVAFTPENLEAPDVPAPEVVSMRNLNSDGTEVAIEFTEALTGNPGGNEGKFTVTITEYDMVPGGALSNTTKNVVGVKMYSSAEELIDVSSGVSSGISVSKGKLSLEVLFDG